MEKGSLVEIGSSEAIFEHPSDAYTKELIDAVPMIGKAFRPPRQIHELQCFLSPWGGSPLDYV